jgi:hypothetical protein
VAEIIIALHGLPQHNQQIADDKEADNIEDIGTSESKLRHLHV